jgi:hypothetical protein
MTAQRSPTSPYSRAASDSPSVISQSSDPVLPITIGRNHTDNGNTFGVYGSEAGQALCASNETVVGGGGGWGDNGAANVNDRLIVSQPSTYPNGSGAGWIAEGYPGTDELQPFQVYALCAR